MKGMQSATAIDRESFRRTCARFATGIAIATVSGRDGSPQGLTVNSFTSVSCCPPLVLICVDYRCNVLTEFRASSWYGINVLSQNQQDLSVRFAERLGDRFAGVDWYRGETGVPLIRGCVATFECCVNQVVEAGDHAILLAEVSAASWTEGNPLIYYASTYRALGSESAGQ